MEESKIAGKNPIMIELESGKTHAWCACGRSANQPWCDGSHKVTSLNPTMFTVDIPKTAALCMCKKTKTPPYCDGTHFTLE